MTIKTIPINDIIPTIKILTYIYDNYRGALKYLDRTIISDQEFPLDITKIDEYYQTPALITSIKIKVSEIDPSKYVIIDGHHRFTAAVASNNLTINALII